MAKRGYSKHLKAKAKPQKKLMKMSKKKKPKQKTNYATMTVNEFMSNNFDNSDDSANDEGLNGMEKHVETNKASAKSKSRKGIIDGEKHVWGDEDEVLDEGNSDSYGDEIKAHKMSLEKLRKTDPEFYKFLEENDKKLLHFNISDEDESDEHEEDQVHKPSDNLEVASDESDFEADADIKEDDCRQQLVTLKMLKNWQAALQTDKSNKTIGCLINAFHAALLRVSNDEEEVSQYKVDGSSVFNAIIQLCVLELSPAIRRFLGLTSSKMQPHRCKRFTKIKVLLRSYFVDLLKLLGGVTSANILRVLLKHLHHMAPLLVSFPKTSKRMIKKLIHLWGTGEEVVRILSFLCILRIINDQLKGLLDTALKSMYMTYIINSKFVSVNSLASINFMRRSLTEMFALDLGVSYHHIFLYIRQLAIHLRNAIMVHSKENVQTVYNWQFISSLKLWGTLLAVTHDKPQLQPLVYPFVQVCLGTLRLVPTAQYYPLRFHVVQILVDFSRETGIFIPVLPFILGALNEFDFNKKHKKVSMKPLSFMCLLRASNSQMNENGFKDSIIESVYGLLLEYLVLQSHSIAFPDLTLLCIRQIREFLKKCQVASYNKKMKQLLEKIKQNNDFIEKERANITFKLSDCDQIQAWETVVKNKGTPLGVFYENWNKMRMIKKKKQVTENDKLGDYNLPTIKRIKKAANKKDKGQSLNPFPSDSESDDNINFFDDENKVTKKHSKTIKRKKKSVVKDTGTSHDEVVVHYDAKQQDMVEDLNIDDW